MIFTFLFLSSFNKVLLFFLNFNRTPISIATEKGNIKIVKLLESKGVELDKQDKIHFVFSISFCFILMISISYFLLYGVLFNVLVFLFSFKTPLYYACVKNKLYIVKYLFDKGCNINTRDKDVLLYYYKF